MTHPKLVEAMSRPKFYPHRPPTVELVQTHISFVFIAGDFVYKVKKAVDFGFLDFTTLAKRKYFCEEELRLNRRLHLQIRILRRGCSWTAHRRRWNRDDARDHLDRLGFDSLRG